MCYVFDLVRREGDRKLCSPAGPRLTFRGFSQIHPFSFSRMIKDITMREKDALNYREDEPNGSY
jgi:hypothetical protein